MPASVLLAEVNARLYEFQLSNVGVNDHGTLARVHQQAADAFKQFFQYPLITYRYQHADPHVETAQSRFFFHQGLSAYHHAMALVLSTPEGAAEQMGKALNAFRQCNDTSWAEDAQGWLANYRLKRTCWMCHREFQGATVHFRSYPAAITPYTESVVAALGQDSSMLDSRSGLVVLCNTCGSALERQADQYASRYAAEVRAHLERQIAAVAANVNALAERVSRLSILR
jgi:hypothetical protein